MPQISINSGVKILSYSFSETQQGKSGADRDISKGGRKMRSGAFSDNLKHNGNITFDALLKIARIMRPRSMAHKLEGTVLEIHFL
ncbi:hypothetical protein PRIPAC_95631 [Pristionchus pacificus]|uniref:Uncharacterized protein n=1 Tax=Pristionchus pacificus TaxID=54126 RepID=A0A2A6BJM0_PRIPA|nr:hypothetical protein PRIPAC_95631 [Pristionchus pacificus]|eukprot:PDM66087.1 hypothetical protein PRIPAC_45312 [Pristionchus pacificus]